MATLKVNITEAVTLNGSNYGAKNALSISGINGVDKRIVAVLHSAKQQIYAGGSVVAQGTYISANVKYIRITNLHASRFVVLHFEGSSHYSQHKLEAGKSFILGTPVGFDNHADLDSFSSETITKIDAKADTGTVDLEIYVATS